MTWRCVPCNVRLGLAQGNDGLIEGIEQYFIIFSCLVEFVYIIISSLNIWCNLPGKPSLGA